MYTLTDLGSVGGATTDVSDVNDRGEIAGVLTYPNGTFTAFLWTPTGGMRIVTAFGGSNSIGYGITATGQVLGASNVGANQVHGFIGNDPAQDLVAPLAINSCRAYAANSAAQIVGGFSTPADPNTSRGFLLTWGLPLQDLTPPTNDANIASDINDFAQVAGYLTDPNGVPRAAVWTPGLLWRDIGTPAGVQSECDAINNFGQSVGFIVPATGTQRAFLHINGIVETLPTPLDRASYALDINDRGEVVGGYGNVAFVFDQVNGLRDLNSLIPFNTGWLLSQGIAINNRGQIVGNGTYLGQARSFLLTPTDEI